MTEQSQPKLTAYTETSSYGKISLALYSDHVGGFAVCISGDFIREWYEDANLEEVWEEVSPYRWEEPDDFPETVEEFNEYLAFCAHHIVGEFEHRLSKAVDLLMIEGQRYYQKHQVIPTSEWLLEQWQDAAGLKAIPKFKQRAIDTVLPYFMSRGQQLSLFS